MAFTLKDLLAKPAIKYAKLKPDQLEEMNGGETALELGTFEVAITSPDSKYPVLGMLGVEPCTGIYLYNPSTKMLGAWHMPTHICTGAETLVELAKHLRKNTAGDLDETQTLEVRIVGGGLYDEPVTERAQHFTPLLEALNAIPNVRIVAADILHKPHPITHAMDSRTGKMIRGGLDITPEQTVPKRVAPKDYLKHGIAGIANWRGLDEVEAPVHSAPQGVMPAVDLTAGECAADKDTRERK